LCTAAVTQPQIDVDARLRGFDDYPAQAIKEWNSPGIAVGIVLKDSAVAAKTVRRHDEPRQGPTAQCLHCR